MTRTPANTMMHAPCKVSQLIAAMLAVLAMLYNVSDAANGNVSKQLSLALMLGFGTSRTIDSTHFLSNWTIRLSPSISTLSRDFTTRRPTPQLSVSIIKQISSSFIPITDAKPATAPFQFRQAESLTTRSPTLQRSLFPLPRTPGRIPTSIHHRQPMESKRTP